MDPDAKADFFSFAHAQGIFVTEKHFEQLLQFWLVVKQWNSTFNLVSVRDGRDFFLTHVLDSLTPLPLLPEKTPSLLDLGTGAGLPGIPLKILHPEMKVILIDASRRRTSFLREVVRILRLESVTIINDRVENIIARKEEITADVVISRATWKLKSFLALASPFLSPGGRLVALKGQIPDDEWSHALQYIENKGIIISQDHQYTLPAHPRKRRVLVFKKVNNMK